MIKNFLNKFLGDFSIYKKRGMKTQISHQEFILRKFYAQENFCLSLHQSIEPFNPKFRNIKNAQFHHAVFVLEFFKQQHQTQGDQIFEKLKGFVEEYSQQWPYYFLYNEKMKLEDEKTKNLFELIDQELSAFVWTEGD